jgi:hypothetical protein
VVHNEWPVMQKGQRPPLEQEDGTPSGWSIIDVIRASLQDFEPRTKAEEQLYAKGLDQIETLNDSRRMRLVAAEEGVPAVLWSVLIFGGVAAVGFTYLFGLDSTWAHRLMVLTLAAVIGLVLFTVSALGHPLVSIYPSMWKVISGERGIYALYSSQVELGHLDRGQHFLAD